MSLVISLMMMLSASFAHEGATGVVKERMDRFKTSKNTMKALKSTLDDPDKVEALAQDLLIWARAMPEYFPENSNPAPSEAKNQIWDEFPEFKELAARHAKATEELIAVANRRDIASIPAAYLKVGQSCKDCHQKYKE
jgi:cytochrome c556